MTKRRTSKRKETIHANV